MSDKRLRVTNVTRQTELASRAELAASFAARSRGLLGRDGLEPGAGLWIVPGWLLPVGPIHMCGMRFAIDAVFLARDGRVTAVHENLQPQPRWALWKTWAGGRGTHSVLELPAGTARRSETQAGDQLRLDLREQEEGER